MHCTKPNTYCKASLNGRVSLRDDELAVCGKRAWNEQGWSIVTGLLQVQCETSMISGIRNTGALTRSIHDSLP